MAHWILQGNPNRWNIDALLAAARPVWPVRRYRDVIAGGDAVAVWLSGRDGGVVAVGRVTGPPFEGDPPDGVDGGPQWLLPFELDTVFRNHPIRRDALKADERFAGVPILTRAGGGNPFPVDAGAWPAIAERVPPHGPVATTVRTAAAVAAAGATALREAFRTVVP